jgi:hypothetical protein
MRLLINFQDGGRRRRTVASDGMTVYDGAVRIQGKDGRQLHPWRVVYHRPGFGLSYTTVTAADGVGAADRALALSDRRRSGDSGS